MGGTVNTFRGKPACECLILWLPVFEAMLGRRLTVYQLIGGSSKSGGTHLPGGAFDIQALGVDGVRLAREMGAATWDRTRAQGFDPHAHGVLNGCPHNAGGRYQIAALAAGKNGLGANGRGGNDDGPAPRTLRTWRQGIEWAQAQMEDEMAFSPADVWNVRHQILGGITAHEFLARAFADLPVRVWTVRHAALGGRTAFEALATTEAKVDAVIEAVKGIDGVDPDTITAAVREAIESISVTVKGASDE